jgi:two-component system clock-associated histidine kinase SasA
VQQFNNSPKDFPEDTQASFALQLLLFIDNRPGSQEQIQHVEDYLQTLQANYPFTLQLVNVSDQPYLAEYFKLVATPALVKIYPEPRQILAGSDIIVRLQKWWTRWQTNAQQQAEKLRQYNHAPPDANYAAEVLCLSDEIFRLKQEKEELQEQLYFKDQVLAMLAHDLRSPLTAASIAVDTLEIAQKQEAHKAEALKKQLYKHAKTQFRTMNRMIADILQTSSNQTAQLHLRPSRLYLQILCQEIIDEFAEGFRKKSLHLEPDLPQDLPAVYADAELIRQVLVNLVENACKYTPPDGKVGVSALHRTTQKIQVTVCDDGPGIPEEQHEAIFDGRFRLERDEAKDGYGIGLSLCRQVIQAHYGHIWVSSVPDQGSCFHFTLPVYQHSNQ